MNILTTATGGGTDAAFAGAKSKAAVLEGMGLSGDGAHSNNAEYNSNHPNMNNNLKDQLKMNGQLKLNLSPLFNAQKPNPVNGKVEIKGFHEEFMARLDEFSQSWRMAAMAEKKF